MKFNIHRLLLLQVLLEKSRTGRTMPTSTREDQEETSSSRFAPVLMMAVKTTTVEMMTTWTSTKMSHVLDSLVRSLSQTTTMTSTRTSQTPSTILSMSTDTEPLTQDRTSTSTKVRRFATSLLLLESFLTLTPTPRDSSEVVKLTAQPRMLPETPSITLMISCALTCAPTKRSAPLDRLDLLQFFTLGRPQLDRDAPE